MSYNITYSPEERKKYPLISDIRKKRNCKLALLGALILLIGVLLLPLGISVRQAILPESFQIADEAVSVFSQQLTEGEGVLEALKSFCRYILDHAYA